MDDEFEGRSKEAVGRRLELSRAAFRLSQTEFAEQAGMKQQTYNQMERGVYYPRIQSLHAFYDTYGLTSDWVLFGDPSGLSYELQDTLKGLRRLKKHKPDK